MRRLKRVVFASVLITPLAACSSKETDSGPILSTGGSSAVAGAPTGEAGASAGAPTGAGGSRIGFGGANTGGNPDQGSGGSCASQSAEGKVLPVYLAFGFDVSGSMGSNDTEWNQRSLKWDPVVAATKAFFEDPASQGLVASMTFFPAARDVCDDQSYLTPEIPMTPLPSAEFGLALDQRGSDRWRTGTPTLQLLRGLIEFIRAEKQQTPGVYAIVLVTDGYPQLCEEQNNSIPAVVMEAGAVAAEIKTYVVGVKNPPVMDAPDTVTNLAEIARAGGTNEAFIVDTGNPEQTIAAFKSTIETIRGSAISCDVQIPPPPNGSTFDKEKVAVTFKGAATQTPLTYDATCAGANTWHYDDVVNPTIIRLCPSTCQQLQNEASAALNVEFTCEPRIVIPR